MDKDRGAFQMTEPETIGQVKAHVVMLLRDLEVLDKHDVQPSTTELLEDIRRIHRLLNPEKYQHHADIR